MTEKTQCVPVSSVSPCCPHGTCSLPIQKKKARSSSHEKEAHQSSVACQSPLPPWSEAVEGGAHETRRVGGCGPVFLGFFVSWDSPCGSVAKPLNLTLSDRTVFIARQDTLGRNNVFLNVPVFFRTSLHPPASSFPIGPLYFCFFLLLPALLFDPSFPT